MVAGIDHARGAILITMDADLQNDPADIPMMVERIEAGHDLVVGWRHQRQDRFLSRRFPSVIANWLIAKVTGVEIKDNGCSLKAYRADLIKNVPLYSEMHRFIPAMASMAGARIDQVKVRHHARRFGESKYGLSRVYKVILDILSIKTLLLFVRKPGFFFIGAGGLVGVLGIIVLVLAAIYACRCSAATFRGSHGRCHAAELAGAVPCIWWHGQLFVLSDDRLTTRAIPGAETAVTAAHRR